jgi:hypothetical protein
MIFINLQILPMKGYTAAERAEAISAELFAISRPLPVRELEDVSQYLFGWVAHPIEDKAVLQGIDDYVINVHPQKNINNLVALFPELTPTEVAQLTGYINSVSSFEFQYILPSNATILTDNELQEYYGTFDI